MGKFFSLIAPALNNLIWHAGMADPAQGKERWNIIVKVAKHNLDWTAEKTYKSFAVNMIKFRVCRTNSTTMYLTIDLSIFKHFRLKKKKKKVQFKQCGIHSICSCL